ncbi:MAG TPA: nucleotidyltransferase family protein, partial [Rudaea sp.]
HGAVILAAGGSLRLGRPKQTLTHEGETLVHRAARCAVETDPVETVIVVGAAADEVFAAAADLRVRRVDCPDWMDGMGASLRAGLAALPTACDGTLIVLCDQPALDRAHLAALVDAWRAAPERAAASAYAGKIGVPALLPRTWFDAATRTGGDRGARALFAQRRGDVVAIANEALAADVDVPDDLARLR